MRERGTFTDTRKQATLLLSSFECPSLTRRVSNIRSTIYAASKLLSRLTNQFDKPALIDGFLIEQCFDNSIQLVAVIVQEFEGTL